MAAPFRSRKDFRPAYLGQAVNLPDASRHCFAFGLTVAQDTNLPDASRQCAAAFFEGAAAAAGLAGVAGVAALAGVAAWAGVAATVLAFAGALAEASLAAGVVVVAAGAAIAPRLRQVNAAASGTSRKRRIGVLLGWGTQFHPRCDAPSAACPQDETFVMPARSAPGCPSRRPWPRPTSNSVQHQGNRRA